MPEITGIIEKVNKKVINTKKFTDHVTVSFLINGNWYNIAPWDSEKLNRLVEEKAEIKCKYTVNDKGFNGVDSIEVITPADAGKLEQDLRNDAPPLGDKIPPNNGKKPFVKNDYVASQELRIKWEREKKRPGLSK